MSVVIILLKLGFFLFHREEVLSMLKYTQDNFWNVQYDAYGRKILKQINKKGTILMFTFTLCTQGTVFSYFLTPIIGILNLHRPFNREQNSADLLCFLLFVFFIRNIRCTSGYLIYLPCYIFFIENRGKNETERILMFEIWVGIPTKVSPNYEIISFFEVTQRIHALVIFN